MRALHLIAATVLMAQPAIAATSLCVETHSSGYAWRDGAWTPVTYSNDSYIVKKMAPADPLATACLLRIASEGLSVEAPAGQLFATAAGCYALYVVGDTPRDYDVNKCVEFYNDSALTVVSCANDGVARWEFEPNGEFTMSRMYATRTTRTTTTERDSLVLSHGKCSVIE